jgi:hypothetical protein
VLSLNSCNKFWIQIHADEALNFSHIVGASADLDALCIQEAILNTSCANVLLVEHQFLYEQ